MIQKGEAVCFTQVVYKLLHRPPKQTNQDHVMVRVLSLVPDVHVLEQSEICSEDIICPGTDLSSIPTHAPHAPILQTKLTPWEDLQAHIL